MAFLRKLREKFHDDWCSQCTAQMETVYRRLSGLEREALPTAEGEQLSLFDGAAV